MVIVTKEEGDVLLIGPVEEGATIIVGVTLIVVLVEEVAIGKDQIRGSHLINGTK